MKELTKKQRQILTDRYLTGGNISLKFYDAENRATIIVSKAGSNKWAVADIGRMGFAGVVFLLPKVREVTFEHGQRLLRRSSIPTRPEPLF